MDSVDFIKVDTEGHEWAVFEGMREAKCYRNLGTLVTGYIHTHY